MELYSHLIECTVIGVIGRITAVGVRYPLHARKRLLGFQAHDMCLHKISYSPLKDCHLHQIS